MTKKEHVEDFVGVHQFIRLWREKLKESQRRHEEKIRKIDEEHRESQKGFHQDIDRILAGMV